MLHRRTIQGSLAAVTAVACILGSASPATGAAGDFGGLLRGQKRCCSPVAAGEGIASGPERPHAVYAAGGRASAATVPLLGDEGRGRAGLALTQASDLQEQEAAPDGEGLPSEEGEGTAETARTVPDTGVGDTLQTFEGSAKPASPDLTLPEEQQLISNGWQ